MDPTTLDAQIAEAEAALAAADNVTARYREGRRLDGLNAAKLAAVQSRTDHNGQLRPSDPEPALAVPAPTEPPTPAPGSFDGGTRPHTPTPSIDEWIADAQASGDWQRADRLNALKLAEAADRQRSRDLNPASVI